MNRFAAIPAEILESAFDAKKLMALQILAAGFASGIIMFMAVVLVLPPGSGPASGLAVYLSFANLFVFIICVSLSRFISRRMLIRFILAVSEGDGLQLDDSAAATAALDALRTAMITRTAILEVPALIGIIAYMLAAMEGLTASNGYYAANLISTLYFLMILSMNFPTRGWAARQLANP